MKKWWWTLSVVLVLALGGVGYSMLGQKESTGLKVQTVQATRTNLESLVLTTGTAKAKAITKLFSNSQGSLQQFVLKEGDFVKKGQMIGRIDTSDISSRMAELDAQIMVQQANLAKARAVSEPVEISQQEERIQQEMRNVQAAQKEYGRINELFQAGAATGQELDRVKSALDAAGSNLKLAQQGLILKQKGPKKEELQSIQAQINKINVEKAQLEKERSKSVIVSPVEGTVLTSSISNGQYLNKGTELLTIGNLKQLLIDADINESDVRKLKIGQEATLEGSSLGKEQLKAKLTQIAPIAVLTPGSSGESEKTRVKVTFELLNQSIILKPGYHVDITIVAEKVGDAVQVPRESIHQEQDGSTFVWVLEKGVAKKRKVDIGIETDLSSQIKAGLQGNETLILSPLDQLKENDPVVDSSSVEIK